MRLLHSLLLTAILFASLVQTPAFATSRLDGIRARGTLRVGTTGDYAPFTLRDPTTHDLSGFDIEQARALAAMLGVSVTFVDTTWKTLAADLAADRFDIAMGGVSVTADRAATGAFSLPYVHDGKTPIARCTDVSRYDTIAQIDRPETRVVVNPGGTNERFARNHFPAAQIRVVQDNRLVFDEIAEGRADVMVTDASETRLQARRHPGVLCAIHPDAPFEPLDKAYWFAKDEAFKAAVDTWMTRSRTDGSFAARAARWLD